MGLERKRGGVLRDGERAIVFFFVRVDRWVLIALYCNYISSP